MTRIDWQFVLRRAAQIVRSYDSQVTLRQLYYRLVSEQLIPNKQTTYNTLSARTAEARRAGWFPDLVDRGRAIQRYQTFRDPANALDWLTRIYRLDRARNQDYTIFVGVEKNGLINLLTNWFGEFGLPVIALGGYSSQTFVDDIVRDVDQQGREAILIYAGDFDPSGEDILRDFESRTNCWMEVNRIALNSEQIDEYNLPPLPGKASDSRAQGFIDRHGELMQVELDALPPDVLRGLYEDAVFEWFDRDRYDEMIRLEDHHDSKLREFMATARSIDWNTLPTEDFEEEDDDEPEA